MSTEIPIWVSGKIRWLSGIDKKTTCKDAVEVLLEGEGINKLEAKDYTIMERWRKVERQLDENSKILKIWTHWGNEKTEVRLCLRRIDNEVDSGRGSPINGYVPSLRRKRNRIRGNEKPPWAYKETLHPRRLAELGSFAKKEYDDYPHVKTKRSEGVNDRENISDTNVCDNKDIYGKTRDIENVNGKKSSGHKSYHCSGTGRLHSTPYSSEHHSRKSKCCSKRDSKQKIRNSENIEKLMKLILAQGATIQNQLQKLKERETQIELLEQERHLERVEKNGRNYLLETYLGSLKDAEIPEALNDVESENEILIKPEKTKVEEGKSDKKHGKHREESNSRTTKGQNKSSRSKSESRVPEEKLEGNLKRALSDNALSETDNGSNKKEVVPAENTKDDYDDVVELRRIQSQIEMWEKVFRINKKLEKEEENLVRLHIKIKKIQSENYRIAKEKSEANEKDDNFDKPSKTEDDGEKMQYEQDCAELEKNLETLKTDLEENSKEIYKNFTRLMEEDEIVSQKRSYLSKIMTDLERTNHEHDMLNEMITVRENQIAFDSGGGGSKNYTEGLPEVNYPKMEEPNFSPPNQRTEGDEENQPVKSKMVKISFEDEVENCEKSDCYKSPAPVPPRALKSILKNRKNGYNKINLNGEFQKYQILPQSYDNNDKVALQKSVNGSYIQNYYPHPERINSNQVYSVPYSLYVNFSHENGQVYNGQLSKLSENLQSVSLLKSPHPAEMKAPFPHSTMGTTKALVHNDTDSSTSSDTSGLCSMYSSSTTCEEPYVEKRYVLDTLV